MTLISSSYILSEPTKTTVVKKSDDHSDHDHSTHAEKKDDHDANDGEDHSGHDHSAHAEKKDVHDVNDGEDHSGHDHSAQTEKKDDHDTNDGEDHSGHDHSAHAVKKDIHDENDGVDHSGHDHSVHEAKKDSHDDDDDHSGHDESVHEEESVGIKLDIEKQRKFGIELKKAGSGIIAKTISLPGEIKLNPDDVAHIVPKVPGSVVKVYKKVGDPVHSGELLAELDSIEIGKAKIDFLIKKAEVGCCTFQLERAVQVHRNTRKLIRILKKYPSLDEVKKFGSGKMGEYREKLIGAYADFIVSKEFYTTEKKLSGKNISSRTEFLAAQNEYKKNEAKFLSAMDSADYQIANKLQEAKNTKQQQELELQSSLWTLKIYGMTDKVINNLEKEVKKIPNNVITVEECKDPNCADCKLKQKALLEAGNNFKTSEISRYYITAPFDGTVTEKHITRGEYIENTDVFVLADLKTVWVEFSIYQKYISSISKGTPVIISAGTKGPYIAGIIDYVSPVVDRETRTASARVILDNQTGIWKPGMFITVMVSMENTPVSVRVLRDAVVEIDGKTAVFVLTEKGFVTRDVTTGAKNMEYIQITGGLKKGEQYVAKGSFELKAHMITKNLDPHAGHGH